MTEDGCRLVNRFLGGVIRLVAIGNHLSHRLPAVIHIKGDGIGLDIHHGDMVDEDILHDTATPTGRFEAETDVGTEELAVAHLEVPDTTAHLRTYHKATMSGKDRATVNHNILTGHPAAASVGILTTLDTDTVVACIET